MSSLSLYFAYKNADGTTPSFWGVRADADRNGDGQITLVPDLVEAVQFSPLAIPGQVAYKALGRVQNFMQPPGRTFPFDASLFVTYNARLIQTNEYPPGIFIFNDLLVSYNSAIYGPFVQVLNDVDTHYDHGGIARTEIANLLFRGRQAMLPVK